ncbi:hypothetical protein [Streptococcus suis]|uniref:hypothetical protein n=1 Tax=Streptococcus suis TaxID=1307 RepID=UPI00158200A4|nr:hypothetical protein [Streptococcus suis]
MTVTIFNKTFANATDVLISAIECFDPADANEFEDEGDFIGLASALRYYYKGRCENTFIFTWLAEIMLGEEIEELTDEVILSTAWELADYSNFDSVHHPLGIKEGTGNEQLTKQFEAIVSRYYESDGDRNNLETLKTDIQDLLGNITLYHPMNLPF